MSRHVADKVRPSAGARVRRYAEVERRDGAEGAHPAVKAVLARPATGDGGRRVAEYVRIGRGREA